MDTNDVGCYFLRDGDPMEDVWQVVAYCKHPTVVLMNTRTDKKLTLPYNSEALDHFVKLIPERGVKRA